MRALALQEVAAQCDKPHSSWGAQRDSGGSQSGPPGRGGQGKVLPCWPAPLVPPQCTHVCWSGYKRGQCRAPRETLFPSVAIGCGIPTPGTYPTGARTPTLPQGWQSATGCRGAAGCFTAHTARLEALLPVAPVKPVAQQPGALLGIPMSCRYIPAGQATAAVFAVPPPVPCPRGFGGERGFWDVV